LLQSVLDLQEKIQRTGTLTGKEFAQRTEHVGPLATPPLPENVVVAPGYFSMTRRVGLKCCLLLAFAVHPRPLPTPNVNERCACPRSRP
jgi:hypothetical protein